jgi:hypothetical protein
VFLKSKKDGFCTLYAVRIQNCNLVMLLCFRGRFLWSWKPCMIATMQRHDPAVSCTSLLTPRHPQPISLSPFLTYALTYLLLSSSVLSFYCFKILCCWVGSRSPWRSLGWPVTWQVFPVFIAMKTCPQNKSQPSWICFPFVCVYVRNSPHYA